MEILHYEDLGDTDYRLAANPVVLVPWRVPNFNSKVPQGNFYPHLTFERDRLNIGRVRVFTSSGSTGGRGGGGDAETIISPNEEYIYCDSMTGRGYAHPSSLCESCVKLTWQVKSLDALIQMYQTKYCHWDYTSFLWLWWFLNGLLNAAIRTNIHVQKVSSRFPVY